VSADSKTVIRPSNDPDESVAVQSAPEESTRWHETRRGESCPECGTGSLIEAAESAEVLCDECGLVIEEELIDRGPEWRAFDQQEREQRTRVGAPMTETLHDHGLTTRIDWRNEDAAGQTLTAEKAHRMHRLRTWQTRVRVNDAKERNLQFALGEIDRMASAIDVPEPARETAAVIYRRALSADLIRGRSIEGIATAALYAACRQDGIPRSLDEVVAVSRVEKTEVGRAHRYLCSELGLELQPFDPAAFVPQLASTLELSRDVQIRAVEIVEAAAEEGLHSGKAPAGLAGAALYAASRLCEEERTQREVADAANVTEATIRNRYREQKSELGF